MRAKIITIMAVIAGGVILFLFVKAILSSSPPVLNEPELNQAILQYCNHHMDKKQLDLPREVTDWKVKDVLIHKIDTLPGPREEKLVTTTVVVDYRTASQDRTADWSEFRRKHTNFRIERRYPEGINVQAYRL